MPVNHWRLRNSTLLLDHPVIMGVLNATPDSFSDGGSFFQAEAAIRRGHQLVATGAEIVDVGGASTRPGAEPVPVDEETRRVVPVIRALSSEGIVTSIDTTSPEVAAAALDVGAVILNDVTGFTHPDMRTVAADSGAGIVIMHMQGLPQTMQLDPHYDDVVVEVATYLERQAQMCEAAGVDRASICLDPGIGFGKTIQHNLRLIDELGKLVSLGYPVMVGASRKSFLGSILSIAEPADRDQATAITSAMAVERGAMVLRVHEPAPSAEAARLGWAIVGARSAHQQTGLP